MEYFMSQVKQVELNIWSVPGQMLRQDGQVLSEGEIKEELQELYSANKVAPSISLN